ncbi:sigma-54-dependent transcriptional regulator [Aegicerativicinus sediminis]
MQLSKANILIIDDDEDVLLALRLLLKSHVNKVQTTTNPNLIEGLLKEQQFDVLILDMNFNGLVHTGNEGLFWLNRIKQTNPKVDVILITAYGDIDLAIKSLKKGASDFVVKPWKNEKMLLAIKDLVESKKSSSPKPLQVNSSLKIIGDSEPMQAIFTKIKKVAPTDANVLILGENGTGKDLIAQAIHENSNRKNKPFIKVDVGSLTESLFESELFGYKKGAFTDARQDRMGRFEAANGGTIFLDEIGNISPRQQARLLTVLQNRMVTPLGSIEPVNLDIRLICATNIDISELADENRFRRDLIYRINTVDFVMPPLRERGNDLTLLAHYFSDVYSDKYSKGPFSFGDGFLNKLKSHSFPGNVRELQYVIERAVIMSEGDKLTKNDLVFSSIESPSQKFKPEETNLEELEKNTILAVIDKNNGNISKSAKELGLTRAALYRRLNKYDL